MILLFSIALLPLLARCDIAKIMASSTHMFALSMQEIDIFVADNKVRDNTIRRMSLCRFCYCCQTVVLVRFKHQNYLVRVRKKTWFGLK